MTKGRMGVAAARQRQKEAEYDRDIAKAQKAIAESELWEAQQQLKTVRRLLDLTRADLEHAQSEAAVRTAKEVERLEGELGKAQDRIKSIIKFLKAILDRKQERILLTTKEWGDLRDVLTGDEFTHLLENHTDNWSRATRRDTLHSDGREITETLDKNPRRKA